MAAFCKTLHCIAARCRAIHYTDTRCRALHCEAASCRAHTAGPNAWEPYIAGLRSAVSNTTGLHAVGPCFAGPPSLGLHAVWVGCRVTCYRAARFMAVMMAGTICARCRDALCRSATYTKWMYLYTVMLHTVQYRTAATQHSYWLRLNAVRFHLHSTNVPAMPWVAA